MVAVEGRSYVHMRQSLCEMVGPQSLSLSLRRVGVLVFCSRWGDSLILHDAVLVFAIEALFTIFPMVIAYSLIVIGSLLPLWSVWFISIWVRDIVVYVSGSRFCFLLICVEHYPPRILELVIIKVKFTPQMTF